MRFSFLCKTLVVYIVLWIKNTEYIVIYSASFDKLNNVLILDAFLTLFLFPWLRHFHVTAHSCPVPVRLLPRPSRYHMPSLLVSVMYPGRTAGNFRHFRPDHVTWNELTATKVEAYELDKKSSFSFPVPRVVQYFDGINARLLWLQWLLWVSTSGQTTAQRRR